MSHAKRLDVLERRTQAPPELTFTAATLSQARAELAAWRATQAERIAEPVDVAAVAVVVERRLVAIGGGASLPDAWGEEG